MDFGCIAGVFAGSAQVNAQTDDQLTSDAIKTALASKAMPHLQAQIVGIDSGSRTLRSKAPRAMSFPWQSDPRLRISIRLKSVTALMN